MARRSHGWCVLLAIAAAATQAERAGACTLEPTLLHDADPLLRVLDTRGPERPRVVSADASRRNGLSCGEERCVANSCGDSALLAIEVQPADDDQTPPEQIGYRFELVSGFVPESLRDRIGIGFAAHTPFFLPLSFEDVSALDATLQVIAVDAAGNESEPSEPFTVSFDGCTLAAVGGQCEGDFNPDTDLDGAPVADAEVFETETSALSSQTAGCSLPARPTAPRGAALSLSLAIALGLAARRRRPAR